MKKILIALLALVLTLLLAACSPSSGGSDTDASSDSNTPTASAGSTAPEAAGSPITLVAGNATQYKIIRPDVCTQTVTDAAIAVRQAIMTDCGVKKLDIGTDFEARGTDPADRYAYEILVGVTNRDESISAFGRLKYNDYIVAVSGTRVVILGGSDEKTAEAAQYFIDTYVKGGDIILDGSLSFAAAGDYVRDSLSLGGVDISEYKIICIASMKDEAQTVANELGRLYGAILSVSSDNAEESAHEIIIGSTKRGVTGSYGADDYSVRAENGKVYIGGGSEYALSSGCRAFLNAVADGGSDVPLSSLASVYTLPDRDDYIKDISKLIPHWSLEFTTPDWMSDFNEKYAAMKDTDGRMMSCLHRGDMVYYPENSVEGIISAVLMGADMVEIDVRKTSDGVMVLMHDETLTRMTNVNDFLGKDGFPKSDRISDWTYEQLRSLRLKTATGGGSAALTGYMIPTFEEVMTVCSERIFVRLDKLDQWDYTTDIWPVIERHKAYSTVIFTWHSVFTNNSYSLVKSYKALMEKKAGRSSICFVGCSNSADYRTAISTIDKLSLDPCVRLTGCDFSKTELDDYLTQMKATVAGLRSSKVRIYIDAHGVKSVSYENTASWDKLYDAGINVLLVNKGFAFCKYISENYSPTAY